MASATTPASEVKNCTLCGVNYPLSDFRPLRRGSEKRVARCRYCRRLLDQRRRAKDRDELRFQRIDAVLTVIQSNACAHRRLALLDECLARFGGPVSFAREIRNAYENATSRRQKLKYLLSIFELVQLVQKVDDVAAPKV